MATPKKTAKKPAPKAPAAKPAKQQPAKKAPGRAGNLGEFLHKPKKAK